ncbi:MAG: class I SAM-dependent methyltransferase [Methylococcaceae bacterium]|nr:class I SAM-dependent methyltransferase [Methylococcaceae bacterium]
MDQPPKPIKTIFPGNMRHFILETYYKTVPSGIRSLIKGRRRDVVFREAMDDFLKAPNACAYPGHPVLLDLIYGWGNEAWSARDEYLAACITYALTTSGSILECGSGLSSILISAVVKQTNQRHWILEHKANWRNQVQGYLDFYGLDSTIVCKPLKEYGDYCWYDVDTESLPADFSLVLCDGPPRRTKGGRYGLIPCMKEKLKPGCVILLDDANRKDELDIATRWECELHSSFNVQGKVKPYIHMTLGTSDNKTT